MSRHKKQLKRLEKEKQMAQVVNGPSVKMVFGEDKFYKDLKSPLYLAGKVYDVEAHMVEKWLRRGGIIVDGPSKPEVEVKKPVVVEEPVEPSEEKLEDDSESEQDVE